jgi:ParB family chromosome partitioning protein
MKKQSDSTKRKGKKLALGRGLGALIPELTPESDKPRDFFHCDIALIRRNRYQPRRHFGEDDLKELSNSIKSQGIIQPLLVRQDENGYELVAGERRLRAAKAAGLKQVPVVVKKVGDAELLEMSIVENIQRENLNPIEEAEAYHNLITKFDLTQDKAALRVGKSRSAVANFLRLRNLPQQIKDSIIDGRLSMGHARALLGTDAAALQLNIWRSVIKKKLSVRQTEDLVKNAKQSRKTAKKPKSDTNQVFFNDLAADLSRQYGTKIQIQRRGKIGKVEIEFYSDEDLDRIIELLKT